MFSTTKARAEMGSSSDRLPKIPFGLNENCFLVGVEFGTSPQGVNFVDFNFEKHNPDGTRCGDNKRVWYPNPDNVTPKTGVSMEDAIQQDAAARMSHILYICETFLGAELSLEGKTFDELAKKVVAAMGNSYKGVPVRLLLQYDSKGQYPEFGRYPTYLELQTEAPSKLKFSRWQLANRCTPSDAPSAPTSGTGVVNAEENLW